MVTISLLTSRGHVEPNGPQFLESLAKIPPCDEAHARRDAEAWQDITERHVANRCSRWNSEQRERGDRTEDRSEDVIARYVKDPGEREEVQPDDQNAHG